ncbi:hypothetical protein AFC83_20300, partial [Mycobacterium avium subsp. paratuberculosis]
MEDRPLTRRRRIRFGRNEKGLERMTKVHKLIAGSLLVGSLAGGLGPGAGQRPDQQRTGDELVHLRHPFEPFLVAA